MMGFGYINPPRLEFVGTLFPRLKMMVLSKMLYAVIDKGLFIGMHFQVAHK